MVPEAEKSDLFRRFAHATASAVGSSKAFLGALAVVVAWAVTGPVFHYTDTWQLVINTGTTIVTFLMVFLIQNTQNRDAKAIHLKLDELIRALKGARNSFVNLESLSDEDLARLQAEFERLEPRLKGRTAKPVVQAKKAVEGELEGRGHGLHEPEPSR